MRGDIVQCAPHSGAAPGAIHGGLYFNDDNEELFVAKRESLISRWRKVLVAESDGVYDGEVSQLSNSSISGGTYTGSGSSQSITHRVGSTPNFIFVWSCYNQAAFAVWRSATDDDGTNGIDQVGATTFDVSGNIDTGYRWGWMAFK